MRKVNNLRFKSFEALQKNLPDLANTVQDLHKYFAHTSPNPSLGIQPEPLQAHITLVNRIALRLIHLHELEEIINGLIEEVCTQLKLEIESAGNFIKELFLASVAFHDFGKLNENFQRNRMQNEYFSKINLLIESQHSILSTYLFLNHYIQKLKSLRFSTDVSYALAGMVAAFSDPILKHHASTFDVGDIDENQTELCRFLPMIGLQSPVPEALVILKEKRGLLDGILREKTESYPLFTLLKLNFSLLTAADYLATLSYQNQIDLPEVDDTDWWGILSPKMKLKLHQQFKNSASYNRVAFEEPKRLMTKSVDSFKRQSSENLNHLRSRILGEVIQQIRTHNDELLFYLKAPTGAGKTNISLAAAIEILQQDERLNKLFYVFPFTTLITQTYDTIKTALSLSNNEIVQLHSKAEWNKKHNEENKDGLYQNEWQNHVDNLFVHYPIVLLSHIRFFDILKGNQKESNYLLHRLANSIVIIDELQSYNPKFWDHINYFINHYANAFNIRFILMSATLPEIGKLTLRPVQKWINLINESEQYFYNVNFAGRVSFDFTLLEKKLEGDKLNQLADFISEKAERYANEHDGNVKGVVEFITKSSAADFREIAKIHSALKQYKLLILTGTILEPRRNQIKDWLKCKDWLKENRKLLLISTQVVEAGVDIDMDIGFKDTSLIDSDEQFAGRINRNAAKTDNYVYLFDLDKEGMVYKNDERLKLQIDELMLEDHKKILEQKDFNRLYNRIIELHRENRAKLIRCFDSYLEHLRSLRFTETSREFQLIEDKTASLYIPLRLPLSAFSEEEIRFIRGIDIQAIDSSSVAGERIFKIYEDAIFNRTNDFVENRNKIRQIQSLLSKFTISVYPQTARDLERIEIDNGQSEPIRYGYLYCSGYREYYDYEVGLKFSKDKQIVDFI